MLIITRDLVFVWLQTRGVRVYFRFNKVSSWWCHNHIFENVWRLLSWQYQFHLQNTYTFCVRMCCKKQDYLSNWGHLCVNYCLTIDDLYNGAKIFNLPLGCWDMIFCLILNFDFRFGQEVKVKLGSPFCNCFRNNDANILNLPLAVVEIWFFVWILNFDFRFEQEVKVKLGSPFCIFFLQITICTMVQKLLIYLLWLLIYDFFKYLTLTSGLNRK